MDSLLRLHNQGSKLSSFSPVLIFHARIRYLQSSRGAMRSSNAAPGNRLISRISPSEGAIRGD
jgi:hypothetical protein